MTINIRVDSERMSSLVTIDEYLALLDGDVKAMVNVLSQFVIDDNGRYLDKIAGRKIIGKLTLDEMKDTMSAFTEKAENVAVPPLNGAA